MKRATYMDFDDLESVTDARRLLSLGGEVDGVGSPHPSGEMVFRLEIPRNTRYISVAREAAEAAAQDCGFDKGDCAAIRLAIGEACNNAVLHGNEPGPCPHVCLTCRLADDALYFDITNPGIHYRLNLDKPMPGPFAENGRGLPLIETLMDSVEVLTTPSGTTVRMRKQRPHFSVSALKS